MMSLCSFFLYLTVEFDLAASIFNTLKIEKETANALLIKSIEYLNFSHF
jgi:hypothetical protein